MKCNVGAAFSYTTLIPIYVKYSCQTVEIGGETGKHIVIPQVHLFSLRKEIELKSYITMKIGQFMKIDNIDLHCQNSCGTVGTMLKKLFENIYFFVCLAILTDFTQLVLQI
jgi:hypothetical protein